MLNGRKVVEAVVATAASTLVVAGILFLYKLAMARQRWREKFNSSIIVDENGLDVLYLRNLEQGQLLSCFSKIWINPMEEEEEKKVDTRGEKPPNNLDPIQKIPLLYKSRNTADLPELVKPVPPQPPQPPVGLSKQSPPQPPATPPPSAKRNPAQPPPPPGAGGSFTLLKPPPAPRGKAKSNSHGEAPIGESTRGIGNVQMKLKPLHWDKVIANADHSLVWDEINDGSFRFDDDLMEALFGVTATNQKPLDSSKISSSTSSTSSTPAKIFILDPPILKAGNRMNAGTARGNAQGFNLTALRKLSYVKSTDGKTTLLHFVVEQVVRSEGERCVIHQNHSLGRRGFLECEEELKVVREEQTKIMELVKRTTTYHQAGDSKDKRSDSLQLFVIVKDFLDMVDQVCLDITKKIQKRNVKSVGSSPPPSPPQELQ
ncbi:formin homologue 4 [Actinidia rufa]|uniref:Formin homologue 4 n=1 Tax=Actinidia rufa TaxID=165716 RepID=A0A7J0GAC6_9ERIC|nr:formin homologue 4 [Actinidia rufa]